MTPQPPWGGNLITLADNGSTYWMHPGQHFLLELGADAFQWSVSIDNPDVLRQVPSLVLTRGTLGVYEALHPGQAHLTAVGDPFCRDSQPPCMAPSVIFRLTVAVQ